MLTFESVIYLLLGVWRMKRYVVVAPTDEIESPLATETFPDNYAWRAQP